MVSPVPSHLACDDNRSYLLVRHTPLSDEVAALSRLCHMLPIFVIPAKLRRLILQMPVLYSFINQLDLFLSARYC